MLFGVGVGLALYIYVWDTYGMEDNGVVFVSQTWHTHPLQTNTRVRNSEQSIAANNTCHTALLHLLGIL